VGIGSKWLTGWLAARWAGVGWRGRLRTGSLLVSRGEFSIAIAALGVSAGVEPTLGPLTAAYVLTLAVLGPLLSRVADLRTRRSVPEQLRVTE
jgi:CPA2 family monovalent cation:H+ antiporter-2